MTVKFKISVWESVEVPEEKQAEVLQGLMDGSIKTSMDLINEPYCPESICTQEMETEVTLTPDENQGEATIEILDQTHNVVWDNEPGK